MAEIQVKTDAYEGPMAMLCRLIEKNEINIYDIPISFLTEQYINEVSMMQETDMDNMSEFILLAAILLEIKSKMLLPTREKSGEEDGAEIDPREELVHRIEEYRIIKETVEILRKLEIANEGVFYKTADMAVPDEIRCVPMISDEDVSGFLDGLTVTALQAAFLEAMKRREVKTDVIRSGFNAVKKDVFTIEQKQTQIKNVLKMRGKMTFVELIEDSIEKIEMIVTFLALLELIKMNRVVANYRKSCNDFVIAGAKSGEDKNGA